MELPLVVGVDGSEPSLRAVDWAADEAVLRGVELRAVYASLWERYEGTALATFQRDLAAANRVRHHTRRIRRVFDAQPQFEVERDAAEAGAFHADEADLVVLLERHEIAGTDVDVVGVERDIKLALDGFGLGDLFAAQAVAVEHVEEVGVAAGVELVGAVDAHAAVGEQAGERAVGDRRADLRLDVVADAGDSLGCEALSPRRVRNDEDRHAIDEAHAGVEAGLGEVLGGEL